MNVTTFKRVHHETPGRCYEFARATARRTVAVHVSLGGPTWWSPNVGRVEYSGITEYRAGWLWLAVQVAFRKEAAS